MVRKLAEMGAEVKVHDSYVEHWWEFEVQDSYPASGYSLAQFFTRQEGLKNLRIEHDLDVALHGADAVVLAVRPEPYLTLRPDDVFRAVGKPFALVDCFCILHDDQIRRYLQLGCEVKGMGRGHIRRIKESLD